MTRHAEVSESRLLNPSLENAPGPQARVCFLEMLSLRSSSSGGSPSRQDGGVPRTERIRGVVPDLSPRRARGSTIARTQRMDRLRPWSDLKFRDREPIPCQR